MRPRIDASSFGSITINGKNYPQDVYIWANGKIQKRKKKLSKKVYGTSHKISCDELDYLLFEGLKILLVGIGQHARVRISDPGIELLAMRKVQAILRPTPKAIEIWNSNDEIKLGLFHVTC